MSLLYSVRFGKCSCFSFAAKLHYFISSLLVSCKIHNIINEILELFEQFIFDGMFILGTLFRVSAHQGSQGNMREMGCT